MSQVVCVCEKGRQGGEGKRGRSNFVRETREAGISKPGASTRCSLPSEAAVAAAVEGEAGGYVGVRQSLGANW